MYHYLFTNDLRISKLDSSLQEAANCFLSGSLPKDKSLNNNVNTLGFYFNLCANGACAKEASNGHIRKVVLNFMKKFQFPNPRTKESLDLANSDGIILAPVRVVFNVLYLMENIDKQNAYLSDYEIAKYLFFNDEVSKKENPDLLKVSQTIISKRIENNGKEIPEDSILEAENCYWAQCRRQIREMVKVMTWSGCAEKDSNQCLRLNLDNLTRDNEADLFEVLLYKNYWHQPSGTSLPEIEKSYQEYMDENVSLTNNEENSASSSSQKENKASKYQHNLVVYGTPGCGKSYYVENELLPNQLFVSKTNFVRTTFFPDYTNVDFVGQVLPKVEGSNVTYVFNPGPFTLALEKARSTSAPVALVIEELNRGNASSIFGDIFQLLDRDENNESRYEITNPNIQDYLNKQLKNQGIAFNSVRIPSNLYIVATMNTSDQNVYKLDNAFKRRWEFLKIRNSFAPNHEFKDYLIPGMENNDITWEDLVLAINEYILDQNDVFQGEDKQVGVYFIDENSLVKKGVTISSEEESQKIRKFGDKVLEYLWDDVAKYNHEAWFSDAESLDALIDGYSREGEGVFSKDFQEILNKYKANKKQGDKEPDESGTNQ